MIRSHQPMQPLVAWRALRRLIADPEQTQEVFTVIRALSGPALQNTYERFIDTEVGRNIIREDIDLLHTLMDRTALSLLPANSFGRHYLAFVQQENITADGLVQASTEDGGFESLHAGLARFETRQRDSHDLWHTLTQYGTDELGEICLLAFTYAQTKNRGIAAICLAGCAKLWPYYGKEIFGAAWKAYKDGKRTAWLPAQEWETLLAMPIAEVRITLGIPEPEDYRHLRAQLVAA